MGRLDLRIFIDDSMQMGVEILRAMTRFRLSFMMTSDDFFFFFFNDWRAFLLLLSRAGLGQLDNVVPYGAFACISYRPGVLLV